MSRRGGGIVKYFVMEKERDEYLVAAEELMEELFRKKWMDDDDWREFLVEVQDGTGVTLAKMAGDFRKGVEMGVSIEKQKEIVRTFF